MKIKTKVLFLKDSKGVFAIFPESKPNIASSYLAYSEGGYYLCGKKYASACEQADRRDFRNLLYELLKLGYYITITNNGNRNTENN